MTAVTVPRRSRHHYRRLNPTREGSMTHLGYLSMLIFWSFVLLALLALWWEQR